MSGRRASDGPAGAVVNGTVIASANASPSKSLISRVISSVYAALPFSGADGTNTAPRFAPSAGSARPGIRVGPCIRRIAPDLIDAGSIGSLNATSIRMFNGTSVFPRGGVVRTTAGGRLIGTALISRAISALALFRSRSSMVSPAIAAMLSGPKPPLVTAVTTRSEVRRFVMLQDTASFAVPSGSETNVTGDTLAAPFPATAAALPAMGSDSTSSRSNWLRFTGAVGGPSWQLPTNAPSNRTAAERDIDIVMAFLWLWHG